MYHNDFNLLFVCFLFSKKDIVSKNFPIHEVHCKRFVVLCEVCEEPVHRDELEEHHQDYHTETECDLCGETLFKDQVDQHKVGSIEFQHKYLYHCHNYMYNITDANVPVFFLLNAHISKMPC